MSDRWRTPPEIFDPLMAEFRFDLDAAADYDTTLTPRYLNDALALDDWPGERIWLNPPYGTKLAAFVIRAATEAAKGKLVVALLPFRCRAGWWHEYVLNRAQEVRCVRGRIKFLLPDGSRPEYGNRCDSCVVVWQGNGVHETILRAL